MAAVLEVVYDPEHGCCDTVGAGEERLRDDSDPHGLVSIRWTGVSEADTQVRETYRLVLMVRDCGVVSTWWRSGLARTGVSGRARGVFLAISDAVDTC